MGGNNRVKLTGSGSDPDPGAVLSYYWRATGEYANYITVGTYSTTPWNAEFTWPSQAGIGKSIHMKLTVCDDDGACGSDTVRISRESGLAVSVTATGVQLTIPNPANPALKVKSVTLRRSFNNNQTAQLSINLGSPTGSVSNPDGFASVTTGWFAAHKTIALQPGQTLPTGGNDHQRVRGPRPRSRSPPARRAGGVQRHDERQAVVQGVLGKPATGWR